MYLMNYGKEIHFDNAEHICSSNFAEIYKDGNLIIKKYDDERASYFDRINKENFDLISTVDKKALLKLRECYSDLVKLHEEPDYNEVCVTGFTYDYVEEDKEMMIDKPMEYTLESIHEIDLLVKELNKKRIILDDPKAGNCIVTKDNLVIIDPDLFETNSDDYEANYNYLMANYYIAKKWAKEYGLFEAYDINYLKECFFNDDKNEFDKDYYCTMKKRLKAKTPRDLMYRYIGELV